MMPRPSVRGSRRSLRARLVTLLMATVAVPCLAIGLITHLSVRDQLSVQLDSQLQRSSERAQRAAPGADAAPRDPSDPPEPGTAGGGELELQAELADGGVVRATWRDTTGDVRDLGAADREALAAAVARLDPADGPPARRGEAALSIGDYRISAADGHGGTTLVSGVPRAPMESTLARLDLTLLVAGLAALAAAGTAGSLIIRRTLRPLEDVARTASAVAAMPLDSGAVALTERAPAQPGGTEVGEVSRALNHLLDNVEGALETRHRSEERMRRFIADASHELRTPLTSIRGYTEMLRLTEHLSERGVQSVDRLEAQSRRMTSLVEDLLLLARLDEGAPRAEEELDLGEIVVEAVLDAQVTGRDHAWSLDVPEEAVPVRGEGRQLSQAIVNLLSNARKHTPVGTAVAVRLRRDAAGAVLEVADDGPGIDPAIQGEIFGRFTRADAARSGSEPTAGLGLPIVEAIIRAHDGDIAVASRPGRTVFTVRLPLAD